MAKAETEPDFEPILDILSKQNYALSMAGMNLGRSRLGVVNELTSDVLIGLRQKGVGGKRRDEYLLSLRVVYYWACKVAADKSSGDLFSYEETDVGRPVFQIAQWLDHLVCGNEAEKIWQELETSPEKLEEYLIGFKFKVKDELTSSRA